MTNDQYFPHDASAGCNCKLIFLVEEQGMEGYGIYWALLEFLRKQDDYECELRLIKSLAYRLRCSEDKVKDVIYFYNLFVIEDGIFYSAGLKKRMMKLDENRKKRSEAGRKGNEAKALKKKMLEEGRKACTDACTDACAEVHAVKESKVKKSRVSREEKEIKVFSSSSVVEEEEEKTKAEAETADAAIAVDSFVSSDLFVDFALPVSRHLTPRKNDKTPRKKVFAVSYHALRPLIFQKQTSVLAAFFSLSAFLLCEKWISPLKTGWKLPPSEGINRYHIRIPVVKHSLVTPPFRLLFFSLFSNLRSTFLGDMRYISVC